MRLLIVPGALASGAAVEAEAVRFDLPEAPLAIFGLQFTADHLGPPEGIVTGARMHLEFNTETDFGSFDVSDILVPFQAPVGMDFPWWEVTGKQLGWLGAGEFAAAIETDLLNGPILVKEMDPGADFSLWFLRLLNVNEEPLGGQFTGSYIEVDITPVPGPGTDLLAGVVAMAVRRRR